MTHWLTSNAHTYIPRILWNIYVHIYMCIYTYMYVHVRMYICACLHAYLCNGVLGTVIGSTIINVILLLLLIQFSCYQIITLLMSCKPLFFFFFSSSGVFICISSFWAFFHFYEGCLILFFLALLSFKWKSCIRFLLRIILGIYFFSFHLCIQ